MMLLNILVVFLPLLLFHLVSASNLTCYRCFSDDPNDDCITNATLSPIQVCQPSETNCRVFRQDSRGKFVSLERGCADYCRAGCGVWGEEIDDDKCYSCCQDDLCNTDNSATTTVCRLSSTVLALYAVWWNNVC